MVKTSAPRQRKHSFCSCGMWWGKGLSLSPWKCQFLLLHAAGTLPSSPISSPNTECCFCPQTWPSLITLSVYQQAGQYSYLCRVDAITWFCCDWSFKFLSTQYIVIVPPRNKWSPLEEICRYIGMGCSSSAICFFFWALVHLVWEGESRKTQVLRFIQKSYKVSESGSKEDRILSKILSLT